MSTPSFPVVFYFEFNLDPEFHAEAAPASPPHQVNKEGCVTYAFAGTTTAPDIASLKDDIIELAEWYENILCDNEGDYGVHDWCNGPDNRVLCLGGYSSYEVAPARVLELMEKWRSALAASSELQASFGPIVRIADVAVSDWDIYQAALAAGSTPP